MTWLRSLAYNLAFLVWTGFSVVALLWVMLLPRPLAVRVLTFCYFRGLTVLERALLGLTYEVRGRENLPAGPVILALKHQSAWETFKLYTLFGDVAIVLKRELMWIPFWGWYQAKAGAIPLNRAAGSGSMNKLRAAAEKVRAEGRSIAIFPQGTRVPVGAKRPYKAGVGRLYEMLGVPVVPVAHNAGLFWPRNSFLKKAGHITVEILPPIAPGLARTELLGVLEERLEAASDRLAGLRPPG